MKINKDGVKFESNVDAIKYALVELERAALRDTAKFIRKRMIEKLKVLPGMKKNKRKYSSKYRDWETDRKSTRLNSSHSAKSRMPSSA